MLTAVESLFSDMRPSMILCHEHSVQELTSKNPDVEGNWQEPKACPLYSLFDATATPQNPEPMPCANRTFDVKSYRFRQPFENAVRDLTG